MELPTLNFILSKIVFWAILGVPLFLITRWIFPMNSAPLSWFGILLISYLVSTVIRGWIEDWEVVSAQREAQMQDDRLCREEEARCRRANVPFNRENFLANERDWDLLKRGHDPL